VAVSHYFPFDYGLRIFYKYSELHVQARYRLGRLRMYVRGLELIWALARLLVVVRRRRVQTVCYAISSTLRLEYLFLVAVKRLSDAEVMLICHDVVPFVPPGGDLESMVRKRARFYRLADRLVVHNQNSLDDLREVFQIQADNVVYFPFTLFDFSDTGIEYVCVLHESNAYRFLSLRHLRPE